MIKLPSFSMVWKITYRTFIRFPVQFAIIVLAVILWIISVKNHDDEQAEKLYILLAISNLAFCITLATDLFSEIRSVSIGKQWLFRAVGIGFCVLIYFALSPSWLDEDLYRLGIFILSGHLLLSFLPFIKKENDHAFWQFNKFLLLRILTAIFYSAVLYLGLAIAVLSVENLFNLKLYNNIYAHLFGIIGIGFNTLFFLTGIPRNIHSVEEDTSYPKGLKLFTQYVLIPLVTIYLAILISYELKIVIQQSLPKGLVSILILGYSVTGILAFLLVYPVKNRADHGWVKTFSKLFFYFMLPLLILLFIAIGTRISNYGITIDRYYLVLLALWLSGITAYFIIKEKPTIQMIPASLFLLAILSSYGPQSASYISKTSQLTRFENLGDDKDSNNQKASVISYLTRTHGLTSLQALTPIELTSMQNEILSKNKEHFYQTKTELVDSAYSILAIKPTSQLSENYINIELTNEPIDISGFDQLMEFNSYPIADKNPDKKDNVIVKTLNQSVEVKIGKLDSISIDMEPLYTSVRKKIEGNEHEYFNPTTGSYHLPDDELRVKAESAHYYVTLVFRNINLRFENDTESNSLSGIILLKKKK